MDAVRHHKSKNPGLITRAGEGRGEEYAGTVRSSYAART